MGMNWFFEQFYKYTAGGFKDMLISLAEILTKLTISITEDFWDNEVIAVIFSFSFWVNMIVFTVSTLIFISDIVQESSTRAVDWGYVVSNFIKALLFIYCNRWIGVFAMRTADILVTATSFREEIESLPGKISSSVSSVLTGESLLIIIIIIAAGIFLFVSLLRFGAMLIHILTSAFYISGIMRGDSNKMGEWLTQTAAISCTFIFQHLMYYLGIFFLVHDDPILGAGLMLSITVVGKVMQKFSFSTGTQNTIANIARTAAFVAPRFI